MIPYPTDVPLNEIKDVISTIAARSFTANAKPFAKDVWTIAGYALDKTVGETPVSFGSGAPLTDEEVAVELKKVLDCCEGKVVGGAGTTIALSMIPWKAILHWALLELANLTD